MDKENMDEITKLLKKEDKKAKELQKKQFKALDKQFAALGITILNRNPFILLNIADAERILTMLRGNTENSDVKEGSTLRLVQDPPKMEKIQQNSTLTTRKRLI